MRKYVKPFSLYEKAKSNDSFIHEGKSYDIPEFGSLSVNGKKLKVEFYNLDDWDSSAYGGGKGQKQAMKDIKLAAKGNNDPLLDDIEMHLDNSGLGSIDWDKPMKLTDGGSSIEFILESERVDEGALAIGGGIILALLGLRLLKAIAKGILGRIGRNVPIKPEKLKDMVSKMVEDTALIATKKGISGSDMLSLVSWKKGIFDKIDSGEITKLKDLSAYIDKSDSIFESDELNEEDNIKFKGKKVDVDSIEIEDIDTRDHPDYSDAFISYAEYTNGKKLSDKELEEFQDDNYELINWLIHDRQLYM